MTSQAEFPVTGTPSRPVPGVVPMALDAGGNAQAASATNPVPVYVTSAPSGSGGTTTGVSIKGTVGTTSAAVIAAGQFAGWLTVQNTHVSNTLFVSFTAPATATDFAIAPGAALTLPFGPSNALNGIGSAAGTTFAVVGY